MLNQILLQYIFFSLSLYLEVWTCISLGSDPSSLFNPLARDPLLPPADPGSLDEIAMLVKNIFGGSSSVKQLRTNSRGTILITQPSDLNCYTEGDNKNCKWRNSAENIEGFNWLEASGKADPIRLQFLMGTSKQPDGKYLSVGSKPRVGDEAAEIISDPIGCQLGNGQITFKHWITRARTVRRKPVIEVCYRIIGETELRECQSVRGKNPGPARITIRGPIEGPFNIVIRALNFLNVPEGGGVAIDDITYAADVDRTCGGGAPLELAPIPGRRFRGPSNVNIVKGVETFTTPDPAVTDKESCTKVTCDFTIRDGFCGMDNVDLMRLWEVTTGKLNKANPLTGIRVDPFDSPTGAFALADFPDPRQEAGKVDPRMHFVLASPALSFSQPLYLFFRRYMASTGTQLRICLGEPDETVIEPRGLDCIWRSPPLSSSKISASRQRQWHDEVVRIKQGHYKVYFIASYDQSQNFNAGQVGLSSVRIFEDPKLSKLLC